MEKRTKLGVAATSLAVAGTLLGPAPVAADDHVVICDKACDPGPFFKIEPFLKIDAAFTDIVFPKVESHAPADVFVKIGAVYDHLSSLFNKVEQ